MSRITGRDLEDASINMIETQLSSMFVMWQDLIEQEEITKANELGTFMKKWLPDTGSHFRELFAEAENEFLQRYRDAEEHGQDFGAIIGVRKKKQ